MEKKYLALLIVVVVAVAIVGITFYTLSAMSGFTKIYPKDGDILPLSDEVKIYCEIDKPNCDIYFAMFQKRYGLAVAPEVHLTPTTGNRYEGVIDTVGATWNVELGKRYYFTWVAYDPAQAYDIAGSAEGWVMFQEGYMLTVKTKDQCGNTLSNATVTFGDITTKCSDTSGTCSELLGLQSFPVDIKASFTKYGKTYQGTKTVSIGDPDEPVTVVVERLFYWVFNISYSDGRKVVGDLNLQSSEETLVVSVVDGHGDVWLMDTDYQITWRASPEVDLGSLSVTNDGVKSYLLQLTTDPLTGRSSVSGYTETTEVAGEVVEGEVRLEKGFPLFLLVIVLIAIAGVAVGVVLIKKGR